VLYLAEKYPERGLAPTAPAELLNSTDGSCLPRTELEAAAMAHNPVTHVCTRKLSACPPTSCLPAKTLNLMAAVFEEHIGDRQFVVGDYGHGSQTSCSVILSTGRMKFICSTTCPSRELIMERMYSRPRAAMRIAAAFATINR